MSYRYKGKGNPDLFSVFEIFSGKPYYAGIHTKRNIKRKLKTDWSDFPKGMLKILRIK